MGLGTEIQHSKGTKPGRTRVIAIAINEYGNGWGELKYPISKCKQLLEVLAEKYDVSIDPKDIFENPDKKQFLGALYDLRKQDENGQWRVKSDDNLLIIISGHGYRDIDNPNGRGYIVPSGASFPSDASEANMQNISSDDLVDILSSLRARHILVIIDTCFSASFTNRVIPLPGEIAPQDGAKSENNPSRWILTSCRNEEVPDTSPFTDHLIGLLTENNKEYFSITDLDNELENRIRDSKQPIPHCENLVPKIFEGGKFGLFRKNSVGKTELRSSIPKDNLELIQVLRKSAFDYRTMLLNEGRFKHARIEKILLADAQISPLQQTVVKTGELRADIVDSVGRLWDREISHGIILGQGGMGKTMSLLYLWEKFLENPTSPLPIFVALNEYNNLSYENRDYFISRYIARHYLGEDSITQETQNSLWKLFKKARENGRPGLVLLLDGFNEVTADREALTIELNRLSSEARNVQLIVTSRYVEVTNYSWASKSALMELVPLGKVAITDYLQGLRIKIPDNEKLLELFGNPMMLTLYVGSEHNSKSFIGDKRFDFFEPRTEAELLWNFQETQLALLLRSHEGRIVEQGFFKFLIRYLMPFIAWRMEKEGSFFVSNALSGKAKFNFNQLVGEACRKFRQRGSLAIFPEIRNIKSKFTLVDLQGLDDIDRSEEVVKYLTSHLHIMVQEGEDLRFLHQNFRDFFAACHLRNCILFALAEGTLPAEWKERTFPVYLRRMLGELEGEFLFDPQKLLQGQKVPQRIQKNLLSQLAEPCRNQPMTEDYTVWNLVSTLQEVRGTLAGADLTGLDLRGIVFNNIPMTAYRGTKYLPTKLDGARVDGKQFLFQGHSDGIRNLCYSANGSNFLSASKDKEIKEWNESTGECLNTFVGHLESVTSAVYSRCQQLILSSSFDGTIKEWLRSSGKPIYSIRDPEKDISSVVYHPSAIRFISSFWDGTVKEWASISGRPIRTVCEYSGVIYSAIVDPKGERILINTGGTEIEEWSELKKTWLPSFKGHSNRITSVIYDKTGQQVLSASVDGTIKLWSVHSRNCIMSFKDRSAGVISATLNSDCTKVISTHLDGTVKEWSISSNDPAKIIAGVDEVTIEGYINRTNKAIYNPKGDRVLTGDECGTIKLWNSKTWECLRIFKAGKSRVQFFIYNYSFKRILSSYDDGAIKEWSSQFGICLRTLPSIEGEIRSVNYDQISSKVLVVRENNSVIELCLFSGKKQELRNKNDVFICAVAYNQKGDRILTICNNGTINEYQFMNDNHKDVGIQEIKKIKVTNSLISGISYNKDETGFLVAFENGFIKVFSFSSRDQVREHRFRNGKISSIQLSDRGRIAIAHYEKNKYDTNTNVDIFTADYGRRIASLSLDLDEEYCQGYFQEKNTFLVFSGGNFKTISPGYRNEAVEFSTDPGLITQSLDFRNLHPDSEFTEEEKERLRRYGAIFNDKDDEEWRMAVDDAYSDLDELNPNDTDHAED